MRIEGGHVPDAHLGVLLVWSLHHEPPQPGCATYWSVMEMDRSTSDLREGRDSAGSTPSRYMGSTGWNSTKDLAIDVGVVAPATALRLQRTQRMGFDATISSGRLLHDEEQTKLNKYATAFGPAGNSNAVTRYVPAVWSTCGGRGESAKRMVADLASNLAQTFAYTTNECVDLIYGQVTSIIANHVGMALHRALDR